ncbi:MAG: hypothetical protein HYT80_10240 [Euryarchaeota archaeon]|nr:hypothetical protein [Euryarchaeota archaeon]
MRVGDAAFAVADELGLPAVTPRRPADRAGIVALRVRDAEATAARLRRRGVRLGARGGFLRLSPHFYTPAKDLEALRRHLRQVRARPAQ